MRKKICIIGAGASGLTAIKCCLDEELEPVCFEKSHDIGGLWRYESEQRHSACVYKSTTINTSKEMMCFSDFPIPKEFPNYMHNVKIMEYFRMYYEKFNLEKYIHFHTTVVSCSYADDYKTSGKWCLKTRNIKTNEEVTTIFDGVINAIGHHADPHLPLESFPDFKKFKGQYMHSHSYRAPQGFDDKRVVVIGIGNSGGDISVELSRVAKQVYLSTRSGAWILNRVFDNGIPLDISTVTRALNCIQSILPDTLVNGVFEWKLNKRFDHELYRLKPRHRIFSQHPTVNDDIPNRILNGTLIVKSNVARFTENGVVFESGEHVDVDYVIFATGYNFSFPFLDESILKVEKNVCRLYKHVWPPGVKNLAVIGNIQPLGAINPISELQSRWITRVFKGLVQLPSKLNMEADIDLKQQEMTKRYYATQRHTIQVEYVNYMDELAEQIGVKPNVFKLALTDPALARKILFDGCTPYQYRLCGPGSWSRAREMIMTQRDRIIFPLHTRAGVDDPTPGKLFYFVLIALLAALLFYFMC